MAQGQDRYLFNRKGIWYFQRRYKGKRIVKSLETDSIRRARQKRNDLEAIIEQDGWDEFTARLGRIQEESQSGTVGELIAAYKTEGEKRGMAPRTLRGNASALCSILRAAGHEKPQEAPLTALNRDVLVAYRDKASKPATVRSTIIQARSLFVGWAMDGAYKDIQIPDLTAAGFLGTSVWGKIPYSTYEEPPQALIDRTIAAGEQLLETDPDLAVVWLLSYYLGLRAGEIQAARWSWISAEPAEDGFYDIVIKPRPEEGFMPKWKKTRAIPLPVKVKAGLDRLCANRAYLVPGYTADARNKVVRRFNRLLRFVGWEQERYKGTHELRALRGSIWYSLVNPQAAQTWLGHESLNTTCRFYATLSRAHRPKPLEI